MSINVESATEEIDLIGNTDGILWTKEGRLITNSILSGETYVGKVIPLATTADGHLEVAIHAPRMPFGEIHVERAEPIFQTDAVYGLVSSEISTSIGHLTGGNSSATATGANNLFTCATGTTALSFSTIQSRRRLRYRAGQGIIGRFTAVYSAPAALSILVAGFGTAESGFYFGYNGTSFGILHSSGGVREVQTLTVTVGATSASNCTITLNTIAHTVALTNSSSTLKTAYEIASATYTGFKASQRGSTVVFVADSVGDKIGTFSFGAGTTGASASIAETYAGVASTDIWIPQTQWNGDRLLYSTDPDNSPSGVTLNPAFGNVFQIDIQYLGFGAVTFKIETCNDVSNPDFVTVHTIAFPNRQASTSITQPSFPFTMAAYSAGSTTNVSVSSASFAGFIAGEHRLTGPRMTYPVATNNFVGSTADTYYPLCTIRNEYTYGTRVNQSIIHLISLSACHDDATPCTIYLIRNATLVGTPNFTQFSAGSCSYWDRAATSCTITNREQIVFALCVGESNNEIFAFTDEITIQPGETISLAATSVTATAPYLIASLNTREDQ